MGGSILANFIVTAAHPLFYAHHANVDRFWRWRNQICPPDAWSDLRLDFYDENGKAVYVLAQDLVDNERLGYSYQPIRSQPHMVCGATPILAKPLGPDHRSAGFSVADLDAIILAATQVRPSAGTGSPMFPVSFRASPDDMCMMPEARKYYYVAIKGMESFAVVAGFGQFMPPHHGGMDLIVTGCFTLRHLEFIKSHQGNVSFVWGPPKPGDATSIKPGEECPLRIMSDISVFVSTGALATR